MDAKPLAALVRQALRQNPACWQNRNLLVVTVWELYEPSCAFQLTAVAACLPKAESILKAFDRLRTTGWLGEPREEAA